MKRLRTVLREYLWATKTSQRQFVKGLGFGNATLSRFLRGGNLEGRHLSSLLRWLLEEEA